MENKLKTLENSPSFVNNPEYIETNEKLDKIYQEKANATRIRSKCNWYEHGTRYMVQGTRQGDPISAYLFILVLDIKDKESVKKVINILIPFLSILV